MSLLPEHAASLQALDAVVRSESFLTKCEDFLSANCDQFECVLDGVTENKLEWTAIHKQYEELVEAELTAGLAEDKLVSLITNLEEIMKSNAPELETYGDVVMLLSNFTDFQMFKNMMVSRVDDKKHGRENKGLKGMLNLDDALQNELNANSLGNASNEVLQGVLDNSARMYKIAEMGDWTARVTTDEFVFYTTEYTDPDTGKKDKYSKQVMTVDMSIEHQYKLFVDFSEERNKFDNGIMCNNCRVVKKISDNDIISEATWTSIPKVMRWAMGIPDPCPMRIATQDLGGGAFSYAMVFWDADTDAPSKKIDTQETGIIKPHPEDPNKSFYIGVSRLPWYINGWMLGKATESMMKASIGPLISSYKKNVLGQ